MGDLKRKLTSRKLWVSVAGFVSMLIIYFTGDKNNAQQVTALIMAGASMLAYIIGEGLADSSTTVETIKPEDLIVDLSDPADTVSSEDGAPIDDDEVVDEEVGDE